MNNKKETLLDSVTEYGGAITSAAVGAGIGAVVAGPVGAIGGALAGKAIEKVFEVIGNEIKERHLSKTENKKIGDVYLAAQLKIQNKLDNGVPLRKDSFYEKTDTDRSSAEEILEGTIFAAQRENEEKKLPYLANLYANINFDETISRPMANQLIKIASDITYRQIIIIAVIGKYQTGQVLSPPLSQEKFTGIQGYENISIASEIYDLYRKSLIFSQNAILDAAGFTPSLLTVGGMGALLFNLMELSLIPLDEIAQPVIKLLSDKHSMQSADHIDASKLPLEQDIQEILGKNVMSKEEVNTLLNAKVERKPKIRYGFEEQPTDLKEGEIYFTLK